MIVRCPKDILAESTILNLAFIMIDQCKREGGGDSAVKKRKLNYRFHNPNPAAATADYILKILLEANQEKVQSAIQAAADGLKGVKEEIDEGHPG